MSALRFLDPEDRQACAAWDEAARSWDGGTTFHSTAWGDVVRRGLGLPQRFGCLLAPSGELRALVPLFQAGGRLRSRRWMNLPQGVAAQPLGQSAADVERLLEQLTAAAADQGVAAILLRSETAGPAALPPGWSSRREQPVVRHHLELGGAREIEALPRLHNMRRRDHRKLRSTMQERGAIVRSVDLADSRRFTRLVHVCMLRSLGHLPYPERFFRCLLERCPGGARLAVVESAQGAGLAFTFCVSSPPVYHLLYVGGLATAEGRDAGRYAMAASIEAAMGEGMALYDMGETGPRQTGLLEYKERWGAERVDGSYRVLAADRANSGLRVIGSSWSWAVPLVRRLPVGLALRLAGPLHRYLQ